MKQLKKLKIAFVITVILLLITNISWYLIYSSRVANYCIIANNGDQIGPNYTCLIKDVTEDRATAVISIVQGVPYSGKFIIDRTTNKIVEKDEAF